MTDMEILKDSIDTLGGLTVPVALNDVLGAPLGRVYNNLTALYRAIMQKQKAAKEEAEAAEASEEPEIEILPAEEVEEENPEYEKY